MANLPIDAGASVPQPGRPNDSRPVVRLVGLFKRLVDPDASDAFSLGGYVDSLTATPYSLGNAYLAAWCQADPQLQRAFRFELTNVVDLSGSGHLDPIEEVRLRKTDVAQLLADNPAAICFSCYAWNVEAALAACQAIKQVRPETVTVLGGRAVESVGSTLVQRFPFVDFVINGEGEVPFAAILHRGFAKTESLPGVTFLGPDGVRTSPPGPPVLQLDAIPSPFSAGLVPSSPEGLLMELSRGCVHDCGYCAWNSCKVRRRYSKSRIQSDLQWAVARGATHITFIDSAINYETELLSELLDAWQLADPERRLQFTFNLRHEDLTESQFELLSHIPTQQILLGMESLSDPAMSASNRLPFDTAAFSRRIQRLALLSPPVVGVVLGLPEDNLAGFIRTMEFLGGLNSGGQAPVVGAILVSLLQVFPSTRLHAEAATHQMNIRPRGIPYVLGHKTFPLSDLKKALQYLQRFRIRHPGLVKGPEGQAAILGAEGESLFSHTVTTLLAPVLPGEKLEGWTWTATRPYLDGDGFGAFTFRHPDHSQVSIRLDARNPKKPCYTSTRHFNLYFSGPAAGPNLDALMRRIAALVGNNEGEFDPSA